MLWGIEFVAKNWRSIIIAVLLAGAYGTGWYKGSDSVKWDWDKERLELARETLAASQKNQKLLVALEETKNANLQTVNNLRAQLAVDRVYLPEGSCGRLDTASGSKDAVARSGVVPVTPQIALDNFIKGLGDEAYRADSLVESCRVVVHWAKAPR